MNVTRIERLRKMLELEPDDAFCLYSLGQEHASAGAHAEAIAWYDRALEADPSMSYACYHKARSLEATGDVEGAIATLRQGLEIARSHGDGKAAGEIQAALDELT